MLISQAVVNDLLSAPIDARDENGDTPIHHAAVLDHEEVLNMLLLKGANREILDKSGRSPLIVATEGGCLRAMSALLDAGADVDLRYSDGMYSALDCAAVEGDLNALRLIIKHGARVDATDRNGRTALNCAASSDEAGAIAALVEAGANVDAKDKFELTSLHAACYNGASNATVALLRHGANKEAVGFKGMTPLQLAAENGHLEVARSLLTAGADVKRRNCYNRYSALDFAAAGGHVDILQLLIAQHGAKVNAAPRSNGKTSPRNAASLNRTNAIDLLVGIGATVEACDKDGWTPLHHACFKGSIEATIILLRYEANINQRDGTHRAPLHITARCNHRELTTVLLASGADASLRDGNDKNGKSPLDVAAAEGNVDTLKELIVRRVAAIHSTDSNGATALHHAARYNHGGAIDVLVWAGANYDARNLKRCTPLHCASLAKGSSAAIEALLRHGADKDALGIEGHTPLHIAVKCSNLKAIDCLFAAGADSSLRCGDDEDSVLDLACTVGRLDLLEAVVRPGVDLESANTLGLTALHRAAQSNHTAAIDFLAKAGANIEAKDNDGCTPLHLSACVEGLPAAVSVLLRHGAEKDAIDNQGRSALHTAVEIGNLRVVHCLLAAGVDSSLRAGDGGDSALDLAATGGHTNILRTLAHYGADVNAANALGATALHSAVSADQAEAIAALVLIGADLEAKMHEYKFTPLLFACQELSVKALKTLVHLGAKIDVRDTDGDTPLHCVAREAGQEGAVGMVTLLLKCGVNEAAINNDGCTPGDLVSFDHEEGEDRSGEEILRLLTLLALAAGNRAWKRRRLLVMCRAHRNRVYIGRGTHLGDVAERVVSLVEGGLFRKIVGFL